ncbi:24370_t:CDS:2 [Entrophospora sp. SA101]|nr:15653_t:CDS:2 [Entrophospora sp. SA101]CAJ0629241.1 1050_t:CDS:2 [Entrophospora sp. SA101]CAJ0751248.1 9257_t:CDS:2 [Entrophospora sp. SA101]CAJ0751639.1 24370_t:CDS:2 [Entrophospora sp. SA101]CAJ0853864.1 9779_t:CDS:2 [Entrophospora sp. SA101]
MSHQQQILEQQQNYYYDGHSVQQLQQQPQQQNYDRQLQNHVQQQQQVQNFENQIYARQLQQINNPTQQILQQQTQPTQNLGQEIIAFDNSLSIIATIYVKSSSHTSSSPTNNDINNQYSLNNRDLNLNVSSFNSRNNNEDPLIAAIFHHMSMIKDYRMKISQHHFELEQIINMLRHRDNQDRK